MSSNLNYNQFKNSIKLETKNEGKLITKRDGNKSKFNIHKIFLAVLAALKSSKEGDTEQAQTITKIIDDTVSCIENISVEDIQNIVEKTLMVEGFLETAKAYIIYRKEHQDNREFLDLLMEKIKRISVETNKDNANIGHSLASKMYQIGAEASKAYYRKYGIPKKIVKEVVDGFIHLHDEDYFDKTINCLSIPLKKILTNMLKYPLEYTTLANPKRIATASSLAGIILQRISNDVFGGTMLPNLDICFQEMIDEGYLEKPTEKEVQQAMQSLICNLQTLRSRAGNQIPFSSITLGLSSGKYGRMVTKYILEEFIKGDAIGSTFIFPNLTFKLLKGINFEKEDVNYDLYQLALKAAGSRMNPTFTLLDSPVYAKYKPREVNIMGCRTFVLGNVNGEEVSEGRGNLFPTTLNLPRIALVSKGEIFNKDLNSFFKILKQKLDIVKEVSDIRLAALNKLKAYDIPYLFGNQIYYNSDKINLQKEDSIKEAMKQGSISIGFVGLAECVKALIGTHHGETSEALTLARKINEFIREYCDNLIIETGYNWSCYATPAESTINKVFKDRKDFGSIEGVTNRDFYSNSFHIPVYYPCKIEKKITIEGMFHEFNNAGRITYIEFDSPTENNLVGMDKCLKYMLKAGVAYAGINFPLDTCKDCRQRGVFNGTCPNCGGNNIEEVRRISGYLGTTDRVNPSKGAEIKERLAHNGRK